MKGEAYMKHAAFTKILCLIFAFLLITTVIPVTPLTLPVSAASVFYAAKEQSASKVYDVYFCGNNTGHRQMSDMDVVAMQFVLTADTLSVATSIPSYSNNTGSVTMALFAFDTDYDTTLLASPLAEYTFEDFADNSNLEFEFPSNKPLPAGEYLLLLYDMKDPTPTADGGADSTGIGVWFQAPHEGQRAYMNGVYVSDRSFPLSAEYAKKPAELYGIPTVPVVSDNINYAPYMDAVLDFRDEANMSYVGAGSMTQASFVTEDDVSFLRLKANKDADDPYIFMSLPDVLIKCKEYKVVLMKVRRTQGSNVESQFFFITDESGLSESASERPTYKDTTDWQYVIINLGANNNYSGQLQSIRLDYFRNSPGSHHLDVQYIALFETTEAAEAFHDNFDDFKDQSSNNGNEGHTEETPDYSTYISADAPADAINGKLTANGQLGYLYKNYPYTMDFSKTPEDYVAEGGFIFSAIDNAKVYNDRLACKAFASYGFSTRKILGDNYGIRGGSLNFDMVLEKGTVSVTLRQIMANDDFVNSGIRFELTTDGLLTVSERDGFIDTLQLDVDLTVEHKFSFVDNGDTISMFIDGKEIYKLTWNSNAKTLTAPNGTSALAIHVPNAGYATFQSSYTRGYVDNVSYTYVDIVSKTVSGNHPLDYSTWVATDDLDRTTPTYAEVGAVQDKYVGLFYFLIHSDDMGGRYVKDVTRFYLEGGVDLVSSKLSSFAGKNGAYWAEPYFGYYSSHDTWVYRKHAYMLDAAGVDFIFLDVSNNKFYVEQATILFDTWKSIRDEGGHTPQIAFMYGDMPFTLLNGVYTLLDPFYNNPEYDELLFKWEGKPLLLGNDDVPNGKTWTVSATTPQTKAQYREMLNQNADLTAFFKNDYTNLLSTRFTVRKCWAWQAGTYQGYWDWLQESPQALGTNTSGKVEQISVSMGVHAHTNRGRSYVKGDNTYNPAGDFGFSLGTAQYGYYFAEQFDYALTQNVDVVMITGWNEWYAGVQSTSNQDQTCGQTPTPGYYMVDQMSPEYSRDGEPMKLRDGVGFGDNYYYQMVSYIRKFKGLNAAPATVNGGSLSSVDSASWEKVSPAFTDTVGDTNLRSFASFSSEFLYVNGTARNDLDIAKVSQDEDYLYFYVTTATPLITVDDDLWMNLYIDVDADASTGWEGFDYVVNRFRTDKTVSVEKFVDGKWEFSQAGEGEYLLGESSVMIKVAKTTLGQKAGEAVSLNFKWADNANVEGDVMRFMELGDTAPNDRFVFAYTASTNHDERDEDTEDTQDTNQNDESQSCDTSTVPPVGIESDTQENEKSKGCRSVLNGATFVSVSVLLAGVFLKNKERNAVCSKK